MARRARPAGSGVPRLGVLRAAAPGCPGRVPGRARPGVRRSPPPPRSRPVGAAAARQRPRRRRRVPRRAPRRGHLHRVRHRRRAPRPARAREGPVPATDRRSSTPPSSTPPCSTPRAWGGNRGRSVRSPAGRGPSTTVAERRVSRDVAVAALQSANHEVGTLQPVSEVAAALGDVPLFVDACASMGRLPLPDGWSAAAGSAHKWGGPAGVGVLLVRKGVRWENPFPGDDRIDERTTGFENVPAALAAAAALQAVVAERDEVNARQFALVDRIRAAVAEIPDVEVVGDPRRPAAPPGHVLLPVRRRGGAGDRARPPRVRRRQRLGVHRLDPRAEPRARGDGRAHARQRPRLADPRHHRGAGRRVPGRRCRASSRASGRRSASERRRRAGLPRHGLPEAGDRAQQAPRPTSSPAA